MNILAANAYRYHNLDNVSVENTLHHTYCHQRITSHAIACLSYLLIRVLPVSRGLALISSHIYIFAHTFVGLQ